MLTYWLMFLIPMFIALNKASPRTKSKTEFLFVWFFLIVIIGFRHEVGGDWFNYLGHIRLVELKSLKEVLLDADPAHGLSNWLSVQLGFGIYGVNVLYGSIFSTGLIAFCRYQPRPWLALAVAIPYLVIVVAMGYSRQGVAIGLSLLGFISLARGKKYRFFIWILIATLFHKTAILLFPLAILSSAQGKVLMMAVGGSITVFAYVLFLQSHTDVLVKHYIDAEYSSQGGAIRVAMNVLPAIIFLLFRRRFKVNHIEYRLWLWVSLGSLVLAVAFVSIASSTAVDRVALYFIPIQLFVFSRLPDVIKIVDKTSMVLFILVYYTLVQFVWLNYASHSYAWLPYDSYLLEMF